MNFGGDEVRTVDLKICKMLNHAITVKAPDVYYFWMVIVVNLTPP